MTMRMIKWVLPLMLAMLCVWPAQAQQIEVKTVPLPGGAEAWLVESRDVPVVTLRMAFRNAGGVSDPEGKEGRARMLAALLGEGAGDMDALAFNQALENHAIHLGFSVDDDMLHVSLNTLSEHADEAFRLLALALTQPRLEEQDIQRVKARMQSSLRQMEEQPRYLATRALMQAVFRGHPYANPTEGSHEGIAAITRADLDSHRRQSLTTGNLLMSVVGDIDAARLQSLVETHLGGLPQAFTGLKDIPPVELKAAGQTEVLRRDIPQTVVLFAGPGIPRDDEDFYIAYVLNHLLGGGTLTSRLGDEIREKRGLAYYAYSQLQMRDHITTFGGGFGTRNDQAAAALKVAMDTLRAAQSGEITQAEVDDAKSYIIGAFPLSLADNAGIASMLQVMQRFRLGRDYLNERNGLIEAVTREDIIRVAKRFIRPEGMTVVAVGDPAANLGQHR